MPAPERQGVLVRRSKGLSLVLAITASLCVLAWLRPLGASDPDVGLINGERLRRNIPAVREASDLDRLARAHSQQMASSGRIYHSTDYNLICCWTEYGENVGMGPTLQAVHDAFMASPAHRANILCRCFHEVGTGEAWSKGVIFVTEIYLARSRIPSKPRLRPVQPRKPFVATRTPPKPPKPLERPVTVDMLRRMMEFNPSQ